MAADGGSGAGSGAWETEKIDVDVHVICTRDRDPVRGQVGHHRCYLGRVDEPRARALGGRGKAEAELFRGDLDMKGPVSGLGT